MYNLFLVLHLTPFSDFSLLGNDLWGFNCGFKALSGFLVSNTKVICFAVYNVFLFLFLSCQFFLEDIMASIYCIKLLIITSNFYQVSIHQHCN